MSNRVIICATVPPEAKANIQGIAELETNSASRIVEKALRAYVASYQAKNPDADLTAATDRYRKDQASKGA